MKPFKHQTEGVAWILEHPRALLADEMRLGKTKQAIDAAQELFLAGKIDSVLVIAPGEVARSVWASEDGQIRANAYVPMRLDLIRSGKTTSWEYNPNGGDTPKQLHFVVTNFELARRPERLKSLLASVTPRTFLVIDEAAAVNSPSSAQTKAVLALSKITERVLLLNGTPFGDSPGHLYSPFQILDPKIIGAGNWYGYLARFAIMGGFRKLRNVRTETGWRKKMEPVQIVGWTNLDTLYDKTRPFVLRRLMNQVFDMPPALDPVTLEVPLSSQVWSIYRDMRDDAILRLESGEVVTAAQAGVLIMRLAQITSGFVGGIDGVDEPAAIGDEKLSAVLAWHEARLEEDPNFRVIFWCRFRLEAERLEEALRSRLGVDAVKLLYGGQSPEERSEAIRLLGPGCPDLPAALVGIARTGGLGLDLSGASTTVYVSNEYSLMVRQQSAARPLGPNQKRPCAYFDFVATGPQGQKTVDHTVIKSLRGKEDLAGWGASRWAQELRGE